MKTLLFALMFCLSLSPARAKPTPPPEPLTIPFHEPLLMPSGEPSTSEWDSAAQTSNFRIYATGETPRRSTFVQLFYDARALYVRFVCEHPANEPLRTIINQELSDARVFNDDCVEVFLTSGPESSIYHLAASAREVRFDEVDQQPERWDGQWRVFARPEGDTWVAVFVIPFEELALAGLPSDTPAPDTVWQMNFARAASRFSEWSQWNVSDRGFGSRDHFLPVVFGERPEHRRATVRLDLGESLFAGENRAIVKLQQSLYQPLIVTTYLKPMGRERAEAEIADRCRIEEPEEGEFALDIPLSIGRSGAYRVTVRLEAATDGGLLDTSSSVTSVIDIAEEQTKLRLLLDEVEGLVGQITDPASRTTLAKALGEVRTSGATPDPGKVAEPSEGQLLLKLTHEALAKGDELQRTARKRLWREASETPNALFCIGNGSPFDQIFAEDLHSGAVAQPLRLKLARQESEAAQLVIIPL